MIYLAINYFLVRETSYALSFKSEWFLTVYTCIELFFKRRSTDSKMGTTNESSKFEKKNCKEIPP